MEEVFIDREGQEKPKYLKVSEKDLKRQWQEVLRVVEVGRKIEFISEEDANIMSPEKPKPGRLYGLVKDHKPLEPGSSIPKLREVVSGSGSTTEYLSAFVDHYAKPEVQKLRSYIEDTPNLLRKIAAKNSNGPLPPGAIPVVLDVNALYPSVPQEEGLRTLEKALDCRQDQSVPTHFLTKLMKLVLTMNTFVWDTKLFNQKEGTAIGTRAAPTFAGIFMGDLEEKMLSSWEALDSDSQPEDWMRFIDDILFWWNGTPGDLLIFLNYVNNIHPAIKFTFEFAFSTRSVVFLDLRIWVDDNGVVQTDLHTKENVKNSYILPS